jgi:hypothetical protein
MLISFVCVCGGGVNILLDHTSGQAVALQKQSSRCIMSICLTGVVMEQKMVLSEVIVEVEGEKRSDPYIPIYTVYCILYNVYMWVRCGDGAEDGAERGGGGGGGEEE